MHSAGADCSAKNCCILKANKYTIYLTAGWSSGMWSRLRNQRSRVQIPVVSKGFCNEKLHLLTSHGYFYNFYEYGLYMYDLCMSIRYLVPITQVLKDT
jgi:hypothetical protein